MLTSYDGMTHVKFKGFLSALALREGTPGCKFNCAANFLHHNPISNLRRCQGLSCISRQAFPASTLQRHILKTGKPAARAAKCPPHFFAPCPASHSPATPHKAEVSALHLQPFPAKRSFCGRQANALFSQIRQKRSGVPSAEGTPPFLSVFCVPLCKREIGLAGEPPSQKHRPLKTPGRTPRPVRRCPFQSPPWSGRRNSCGRYFCAVHGSRRPRPACRPFWPWE